MSRKSRTYRSYHKSELVDELVVLADHYQNTWCINPHSLTLHKTLRDIEQVVKELDKR